MLVYYYHILCIRIHLEACTYIHFYNIHTFAYHTLYYRIHIKMHIHVLLFGVCILLHICTYSLALYIHIYDSSTYTSLTLFSTLISPSIFPGVEALALTYQVQWPLSIVLSRRAVTKYQLLSRILFFSKYVEVSVCYIRVLCFCMW